jgi:pentose-5-phosphate-3-epimerase
MIGSQWVKDVADAGGKSFTFHIEALEDPRSRFALFFSKAIAKQAPLNLQKQHTRL